jgi:hypothetical protein
MSDLFTRQVVNWRILPTFPVRCALYHENNIYMNTYDGKLIVMSTDLERFSVASDHAGCYCSTKNNEYMYFYARKWNNIHVIYNNS